MTGKDPVKEVDILIVGAGVAGLSAAIAASHKNQSVVLIEKSSLIGGTARYANGSIWIPNNYLSVSNGIKHNEENQTRFILSECWNLFDVDAPYCGVDKHTHERAARYVTHGHQVIDDLRRSRVQSFTQLDGIFKSLFFSKRDSLESVRLALEPKAAEVNGDSMRAACSSWDYHWENEFNQVPYGKHIWASVDLRASGKFFGRGLRQHFWHIVRNLTAIRSWSSTFDQLQKLFSKFWGFGHGYILVERFRRYLRRKQVPILTRHQLVGVEYSGTTVKSVDIKNASGEVESWKVNQALILASGCSTRSLCGNQNHETSLIQSTCVVPTNTGDALDVLEDADIQVNENAKPLLAQTVMQLAKQQSGISHEPVFFLYGDSFFVVDRHGRRVMNEKLNYHDRAQHHLGDPEREFLFLICDRRFKERNWGFGISLPFDPDLVLHAKNEVDLSERINRCLIEHQCEFNLHPDFASNLCKTKAAFNENARSGIDDEFGRGQNAYDVLGFMKPDHDNDSPSRTMHPLVGDNLYACIYGLSAFSTHGGLVCDEDSRVLTVAGNPWENLYAVGTCAASFLNGNYPSHGMSIGTGLVFGYLAGLRATSNLERLR